ncbi:ubiquinone biosynthesis accessory factor UbiJ [Salinimonas sediminis]|uniref:Ubiquinone biosynthesis accessory factor UbiJ n=1 Tax=Salinimonas sediminis TaxID=2303538 RepID=A0A346NQT6_9ALTE|nr:SCP2 sterol-binding domain-containing protein [Salinimonas sediminis]AXR07893.1 hypothetical protein D0Y50_16925 [Salinimonas sediminis]
MPASALLSAIAETAINRVLALDEDSQARLLPLNGKRLTLYIDQFPHALTLVFSQRVDVLTELLEHSELVAQLDENSCCIRTSLEVLPKLTQTSQLTQLIRQGELHLDGDLHIAQHTAALFGQLDIDPQEWLSHYTGDVIAHQAGQTLAGFKTQIANALARSRAGISNALTEEKPIGVGKLAVMHFNDEVDALRDDVQRFEARLNALNNEQ